LRLWDLNGADRAFVALEKETKTMPPHYLRAVWSITDSDQFLRLTVSSWPEVVRATQSAFLSKETACLGELLNACNLALALIHESQLFDLLRDTPVDEERNDTVDTALER
jgi:hypothetical protein